MLIASSFTSIMTGNLFLSLHKLILIFKIHIIYKLLILILRIFCIISIRNEPPMTFINNLRRILLIISQILLCLKHTRSIIIVIINLTMRFLG